MEEMFSAEKNAAPGKTQEQRSSGLSWQSTKGLGGLGCGARGWGGRTSLLAKLGSGPSRGAWVSARSNAEPTEVFKTWGDTNCWTFKNPTLTAKERVDLTMIETGGQKG